MFWIFWINLVGIGFVVLVINRILWMCWGLYVNGKFLLSDFVFFFFMFCNVGIEVLFGIFFISIIFSSFFCLWDLMFFNFVMFMRFGMYFGICIFFFLILFILYLLYLYLYKWILVYICIYVYNVMWSIEVYVYKIEL